MGHDLYTTPTYFTVNVKIRMTVWVKVRVAVRVRIGVSTLESKKISKFAFACHSALISHVIPHGCSASHILFANSPTFIPVFSQ